MNGAANMGITPQVRFNMIYSPIDVSTIDSPSFQFSYNFNFNTHLLYIVDGDFWNYTWRSKSM